VYLPLGIDNTLLNRHLSIFYHLGKARIDAQLLIQSQISFWRNFFELWKKVNSRTVIRIYRIVRGVIHGSWAFKRIFLFLPCLSVSPKFGCGIAIL
jgi:hypothetical protein